MDRIIKTLNVYQDQLVVESKGIYSVEKFIVARRLMYWQVYLHKAALAAENMLVNILRRVRQLVGEKKPVYLDSALQYFLEKYIQPKQLSEESLQQYIQLDDNNIEFAIKQWQFSEDNVLRDLCRRILSRQLLKLEIRRSPFDPDEIHAQRIQVEKHMGFSTEEAEYLVFGGYR